MPKPSSTDRAQTGRPSALEMFTDRVSEQELLARLMAPSTGVGGEVSADFITVFYGVGGVGKSTLCRQMMATCREKHSNVAVVMLNLDFGKWTPEAGFAHFLAALLPELGKHKIPCPLAEALLLMYSQADTGAQVAGGAAGLWSGAVSVLEEAAGVAGIPGIGLVIEGAQWLRDKKRQADTAKRLRELRLWPSDDDEKVDLLDLEEKLASALYEDLKEWAVPGKSLRLLLDGFERIQSRERKRDCQKLIQSFAGYIAAAPDPEMKARVRILIFGRDKLRWDELYDDSGWNDFWTQHLLAGLGEADAREFLGKHAYWLSKHGETVPANAIHEHTDAILDASDEHAGSQRLIYPYYLDLAVDLVRDAASAGRKPDLGKTPGDLQDRFFRYLPQQERHLLKILALAEVFDEDMFDALVRDQRVAGYAVGTFRATVAEGRSYVTEGDAGTFRFHRLMEDALHDLWMKSDTEKEQGREAVRWLLSHLESRIGEKDRMIWGEKEIECWRRGVEILVTQGYERELVELSECDGKLKDGTWTLEDPVRLDLHENFLRRIFMGCESILGPEHPDTLSAIDQLAFIYYCMDCYELAEALYRRAMEGKENSLGLEHPDTLASIKRLAHILSEMGDYEEVEALYRKELEGHVKVFGPDHPDTLNRINKLGSLLRDRGNYSGAEALYRQALEGYEKFRGPDDPDTLDSINNLGHLLRDKGDYKEAEAFYSRAFHGSEKAFGPEHPRTLECINNLGNLNFSMCDYGVAAALYLKVLESGENYFPFIEHLDTLKSINNLGAELKNKGDLEGADALYSQALKGYEKVLERERYDTSSALDNPGTQNFDTADYEVAEALFRWALAGKEKGLGPEHPDTLASIESLANLLRSKGDYEEAEGLYRRALEGLEKVFGPEHPITLDTIDNLAFLLATQNRRIEALTLLRLYGGISEKVLVHVRYNLACYECLEGNHEEAKRLISEHLKLHPEMREQALAEEEFAAIRDWIVAM